MVGSPGHQLADPDHQQWSPHNAQICAAGAERGIDAATAPNGGSARVYQELSAPLAIPATAEQAGGQAACLCVASAGRGRPHVPQVA